MNESYYRHIHICVYTYICIYTHIPHMLHIWMSHTRRHSDSHKQRQRQTSSPRHIWSTGYIRGGWGEVMCVCIHSLPFRSGFLVKNRTDATGWRRPIECLKLQVIFRKRATNYRALFRKTTYKDMASYGSLPPFTCPHLTSAPTNTHTHTHKHTHTHTRTHP